MSVKACDNDLFWGQASDFLNLPVLLPRRPGVYYMHLINTGETRVVATHMLESFSIWLCQEEVIGYFTFYRPCFQILEEGQANNKTKKEHFRN